MKPLNGDQKGADADEQAVADTAAGAEATVVVLDGTQKQYLSLLFSLLGSSLFVTYDEKLCFICHLSQVACCLLKVYEETCGVWRLL